MGRTTSITVSSGAVTLWEATYGYDVVGNRIWSKYGTEGDAYAYDATYQVTGVKYGSATPESGYAAVSDQQGSSTWAYDPAGNSDTLTLSRAGRTNQTVTGSVPGVDPASTNYTANDISSYTAVTEDGTPVNIAHSSRADLSAFADWTYTHDVYGNIIQAANGTQTVRFYFDGSNRRVGKEIDTEGPIWWLHDGIHLVEQHDSVTGETIEFVYEPGIDRPLAMISGGVTKFFHQDVHGNVVALTNGGGDLIEEYRYDVWGNFEALDQNGDLISGNAQSPFLFTARQWDPEPGIYYYRARCYSQTRGRFMQQDPIGVRGGDLNLVRYVENSPMSLTDPQGLQGGRNCCGGERYNTVTHCCHDEEVVARVPRYEATGRTLQECVDDVLGSFAGSFVNSVLTGVAGTAGAAAAATAAGGSGPGALLAGGAGAGGGGWAGQQAAEGVARSYCEMLVCPPQE